jgi:hypothetical protein
MLVDAAADGNGLKRAWLELWRRLYRGEVTRAVTGVAIMSDQLD